MQHHFEIEDAKKLGIEKAVMLDNLRFWLQKNIANDQNIYDGRVWTYNSAEAFSKLFPYWSRQKIARMLRELEEAGVIISGNYNKTRYDRTKWYSLNDESTIVHPQTMESTPGNNELFEGEQPIPDTLTDSKPNKNTYTPEFSTFWESYPRNTNKVGAFKAWNANLKNGDTAETMIQAAKNYAAKMKADKTEPRYMLHASTFLGPNRRFEDFETAEQTSEIPTTGWYTDKLGNAYKDGKKVGHYDGGRLIPAARR
jgi:hypothetical protein